MQTAEYDVFRAVGDPTRRELLEMLRRRECNVSEMQARFSTTQQAISKHLAILLRAGLVCVKPEGRRRLYQLTAGPIRDVYEWSARYVTDPFGHVWAVSQRPGDVQSEANKPQHTQRRLKHGNQGSTPSKS